MIPGRTVLLEGNKKDMGCHRFTLREKNLIIAATDMENFDDRSTILDHNEGNHYSKLRKSGRIYGTAGLFKDTKNSNEVIKFVLVP